MSGTEARANHRNEIAKRMAQTMQPRTQPFSTGAVQAQTTMSGNTQAANNPGGWFGGWLGVSPWWRDGGGVPGGGNMGVTNGSEASPGQVGEWVQLGVQVPFTAAPQVQSVTLGTLPAGDWDCWALCVFTTEISGAQIQQTPIPAGFTNFLAAWAAVPGGGNMLVDMIVTPVNRALTSVSSTITFAVGTNTVGPAPTGGTFDLTFLARRRR